MAPVSNGSVASMMIHTSEIVSSPMAVNSGLWRLNQFQKNRMLTNRNP